MRWLLVLALAACGSKKDPGPTCEQVVDHMLSVTKTQLPGHEMTNLGNQKKAMVAQCEARNMDNDVRTCLMGATTISEIAKCRGAKSDVMERPRRPRVPPGSGSAPTALPFHPSTGSGSAAFVHPPAGSGSAAPTGTGSAGSGSNRGSGSAK